ADISGVELARQIRSERPGDDPPGFVLLSSAADNADTNSLSKCGQAMLLQKPFTPEQLVDALRVVSAQDLTVLPANPAEIGLTLVRPIMLGRLPAAPDPGKIARLRVLIVDDSKPARGHIQSVLGELGITQVSEANDGAQAVAALVRDSFDLIVTDYNMPLMDG